MRRAFVTLYGLVVVSVLFFGWGLDQVWQFYSPHKEVSLQAPSPTTFSVLNFFLADADESLRRLKIQQLAQTLNADVRVLQVDDFAQTALVKRINAGEWVAVDSGADGMRYYQKMPNSPSVISWQQSSVISSRPLLYRLLLVAFYLFIALVIFFWVWPLSRDLAKLEKQTRILGYHSTPENLHISQASAVYDLASAFNRMAQRVRDLLLTQKEMTYAVSHELRTPLARMKFGLEMAGVYSDSERIKRQLIGVREDVTEMDQLVNQLLAYAEFEQQERSLDCQAGDLGALVQQLIQRVALMNNDTAVNIVFDNGLSDEPVWCEWYLMERAILNVLQNARRFARTQVFVSLNREGSQYQLWVDDDGPGVPVEERSRILQSFVRLNNQVNSQSRGFGLGLSIVQRIMRWHSGSVTVDQAPIGGARFRLSWPLPKQALRKPV